MNGVKINRHTLTSRAPLVTVLPLGGLWTFAGTPARRRRRQVTTSEASIGEVMEPPRVQPTHAPHRRTTTPRMLPATIVRPTSAGKKPGTALEASAGRLLVSSRVRPRPKRGGYVLGATPTRRTRRMAALDLSLSAVLGRLDFLRRWTADAWTCDNGIVTSNLVEETAREGAFEASNLLAAARQRRARSSGPASALPTHQIQCMAGPAQAHRDFLLAVCTVLLLPIAMGRRSRLARANAARAWLSVFTGVDDLQTRDGRRWCRG